MKFDFDTHQHVLLKEDLFGTISKEFSAQHGWLTYRNTEKAPWWTRSIARYLAQREADTLRSLPEHALIPRVHFWDGAHLLRSWIDGESMHTAQPTDKEYYKKAFALIRFLHINNVAHNDLSKETNWLVTPQGEPALVDFQLARYFKVRSRWFRNSAREDIRYLLKHKKGFCPNNMTKRESNIVSNPALTSRIWKKTVKPVYLFVTRKILNWQDREGAYDRNDAHKSKNQ